MTDWRLWCRRFCARILSPARSLAMVLEPLAHHGSMFRSRRADRLKLLYWDGTGLVMAYKRLETATFTWPAIKDGVMALNHAQFEALFSGLDWRKVKALESRPPAAAE